MMMMTLCGQRPVVLQFQISVLFPLRSYTGAQMVERTNPGKEVVSSIPGPVSV